MKNPFLFQGIAVIWYGLLFGLAGRLRHPQSAVVGKELWRSLELYYHALGGELDRGLARASQYDATLKLSTHAGLDLQAWSEPGMLYLPKRINRYRTRELNRELYYWLAAFLAVEEPNSGYASLCPGVKHLLHGVKTSASVLQSFPGLSDRYQRLCENEVAQRRIAFSDPESKKRNRSLQLEAAFRYALGDQTIDINQSLSRMMLQAKSGEKVTPATEWQNVTVPFLHVPLWSFRTPKIERLRFPWWRSSKKPQSFAPEKIQPQAKFDPDFVPDVKKGLAATQDQFTYPEWNYLTQSYLKNWCRLTEYKLKGGYSSELDAQFTEIVRRVQRRFMLLRQETKWKRQLEDAQELDIDVYVTSVGDRKGYGRQSSKYYREMVRDYRDLSVIVLMDASRSTEAWANHRRVIDIAKQSLAVLAEVLDAAGDEFAMYSFSSDSRLRIRCDRIKTFDDPYDRSVQQNLLRIKPQNYTRIGPVIRHMGVKLQSRSARQKLLLILSDGKPNDPTDRYEGKYALEDTRKALLELRMKGIKCFGLTIDQQGPRYLKHLFGDGNYAVYSEFHSLPDILPNLYARLTDL